jgi:hypothetical protein
MRLTLIVLLGAAFLVHSNAFATNAKYQQQLENSGCTQVSELEGCDITKSKAENAKAGFVASPPPSAQPAAKQSGQWVARSDSGATVATIHVGKGDKVSVNGKSVKAKRVSGVLHFQQGMISFTLNEKGESFWMDTDAGTKGPVVPE